ncbi:heparin lyase I family protein [Salipiger thiooxidans]|uniref:heparin lyase I family protein n=1 Tax=Salipiger thiooxidans TaxID=282683 RepID=UPI001CFAD231|nr:heparin lyase I family protein [Salipiger thiooxidans]
MTMKNNDPAALRAREWTSATWDDQPFAPQMPPDATSRPDISLGGQTWEWNTRLEEGRITKTDDVLTFVCDRSDHVFPQDTPNSKVRTELTRQPRCPADSLVWYAFDFRIVGDIWPFTGWMMISQTHQATGVANEVPGEPVFNLELDRSTPRVQIVRRTQNPADPGDSVFEILGSFDIVPGQWYRYVAKVQFSAGGSSGTGSAHCWVDGALVLDTDTMPGWDGRLGYEHDSRLGAKIGTYRHESVAARTVVEFRNPEIQSGHGPQAAAYAGYE